MLYAERKAMHMKSIRISAAAFALLLTAFTGYVALDTFVLPRTAQTGAGEANLSVFASETSAPEAIPLWQSRTDAESQAQNDAQTETQTDTQTTASAAVSDSRSYSDSHIQITLTEYEEYDTAIYVADIQLDSAEYLKTAFANNSFGKNITAKTTDIAAQNNAILAINGDFYGTQERGIVIRNGVIYRDTPSSADVLCVCADGTMKTYSAGEKTAQEMLDEGVWQAFSFGPALITDGQVAVDADDEVGRAMASNPRTAVGMISPLHYVFVVSDGRTQESAGLSLQQLAIFMQGLGVQTAYNLDGGGSSTMVFQGALINNPSTSGRTRERSVSDIVYIG